METNNKVYNVLAERYASSSIKNVWSQSGRIIQEREFWIAILKAQKSVGIEISDEAIKAYEKAKESVNLDSINNRERVTKHDVKARIEEFNELAGFQDIHKGMTSRDLTENVEQLQVLNSLKVILEKSSGALLLLTQKAKECKDIVITARTHNVAAQLTTLGKRLAMFAEEFHYALKDLEDKLETYPVRGLKGAVGTQLDLMTLLNGDKGKVETLESKIIEFLGFKTKANVVGQVYPRSYDYSVVSSLVRLASAPSSFSKTLRIMAGHETLSEGFLPGQTGSSAMPHKINSRSSERINGFHSILKGYEVMLANLAGDQWNEGDVSCSVVRRVALPDSFFAIDGLLETFISVLSLMEAYPKVIEKENDHYLPFLMTTTFLMEAVKKGVGRETAHSLIKKHALAAVNDLRTGVISENDFLSRIENESELKFEGSEVKDIYEANRANVGLANEQLDSLVALVKEWSNKYPESVKYRPKNLL